MDVYIFFLIICPELNVDGVSLLTENHILFKIYVGLFLSVSVGFAIVWLLGGENGREGSDWLSASVTLMCEPITSPMCLRATRKCRKFFRLASALLLFVHLNLPIHDCFVKQSKKFQSPLSTFTKTTIEFFWKTKKKRFHTSRSCGNTLSSCLSIVLVYFVCYCKKEHMTHQNRFFLFMHNHIFNL